MLKKGHIYCLRKFRKFSLAVNNLHLHSWSLSSREFDFLQHASRFRDETMVRAPLIIFVEKEFSKKQKAVAALLDEVSSVKQSQCMYYNNLAGYIHKYKEIHDQSTQINCEQFEEKIQELKNSIHEDIANLVIKTITLKVLKAEMKDLKKDLSVLMDRAKIAESYRQTLCDLWDMATKIAKLV
ncbi:hypothetical protein QL285_008799 [Trifolium repens]|nr:hypothetical protein QL285_015739 [Trifolium repens]KAK2449620.1 hypothetical protein QL285_008799 [Trifolium repens]